jgi:Protein of unknown function (DUF3465)
VDRLQILRKLIAFIGLLGVVYALALQHGLFDHAAAPTQAAELATARARSTQAAELATAVARSTHECSGAEIAAAYRNHESRIEVCGQGVIAKVLRDDTQGTRHQRFIVRLPSGQSVLIAYNIDIAPRIEGLRPGSPIEFTGEYEWNPQGGVVHWTHHDPSGRHSTGWIEYGGRRYE